jgi:hydrogenase/urease accessory protein HupE
MPCNRHPTLGLAALLLGLPTSGAAHSPIAGIGDFYNGILHPLLVPAHLLALLAAGLLIGQQAQSTLQPAAMAYLGATVIGLLCAGLGLALDVEGALLVGAAICGLLVAWSPSLPAWVGIALGAAIGYAIGIDSGQLLPDVQARIAALLGSGIGIYLLFLYAMAIADRLRQRHWQKIAVRVVGSWIAASALLVLSLAFAVPA